MLVSDRPFAIGRRPVLAAGVAAAAAGLFSLPLGAAEAERLREAIARVPVDPPQVRPGRVTLTAPLIADDGASVPVRVVVDSPMTAADHVTAIHLFAPRNRLVHVGGFHLSPLAGRADLQTRIRVAESQTLLAVATLNDGTAWSGSAEIRVTTGGCRS